MNARTRNDDWLTIHEAEAIAKVHHTTLRRAMRNGELQYVRVGGKKLIRFRRSWIDHWLGKPVADGSTYSLSR